MKSQNSTVTLIRNLFFYMKIRNNYGLMCERNYCMFKHELNVDDKVENIDVDKAVDANSKSMTENANEVITDILSDDETSGVGDQEDSINQNFENVNMTFVNPS